MTAPSDDTVAVHPRNGRPDRAALAEIDAGLATETDGARVDAHVQACAECQAVLAGLRATRADVGRLGGGPMPAAVVERIATALAAQPGPGREHTAAAERAEPGPMTQPSPGATAGPDGGRHRTEVIELRSARRVRRLRVAGGLAAGLVLLGGTGYLLSDMPGGEDAATTAADGGAQGESAVEEGGETGTTVPRFDRQSLEAAVGQLLQDSPQTTSTNGSLPGSAPTAEEFDETAVDRDCLISIPLATSQALAITRAIYEGQPAIVVLFPAEPGQVQVTVVSDCADGALPAVIDEFTADR